LGIDTDDENDDSLIWWPSRDLIAIKHFETKYGWAEMLLP
jgi:hypothetical protein